MLSDFETQSVGLYGIMLLQISFGQQLSINIQPIREQCEIKECNQKIKVMKKSASRLAPMDGNGRN